MSSAKAASSRQPFASTGIPISVSGQVSFKSLTPSPSVSFCDRLHPFSSIDNSGFESGQMSIGSFTPSPSVSTSLWLSEHPILSTESPIVVPGHLSSAFETSS